MMDSLLKRIEKNRKAHTRWLAMVLCLSMLVSLGTFAGLHKSAQAKVYTKEVLDCPYACEGAEPVAHVHNDDCFEGETLVCTLPEMEAHTHTEECFAEQRRLTCGLEENPAISMVRSAMWPVRSISAVWRRIPAMSITEPATMKAVS